MSRYLLLSMLLGASTLMLVGCGPGPEAPGIPTGLEITQAINNGLGVKLEWDAVEEADGYVVLFEGAVIDSVTTETFNDEDPGDVGQYRVKAYADGEESDPSDAVSTVPKAGGATIYERSSAGYSCFRWGANGTGATFSIQDPYNGWDFYADDFQAGTDPLHIHLVSPSYNIAGSPYSTEDTTWISENPVNYDTLHVAPTTGYSEIGPDDDPSNPTEGLNAGEAYVVEAKVDGNTHYAKVKITSIGTENIDFSYAFQAVPGFRRLDTD